MSFYGLHTTKKRERDLLLERGEFEEIIIPPAAFHWHSIHKPIVIEEDTGKLYEHDRYDFDRLLQQLDQQDYQPDVSEYYHHWQYKGQETRTRLGNLPKLYQSIKKEGIHEPVACEVTGERLDGSYRTKIALHLGISEVKARRYRFTRHDVDEDFLTRKLKAREASSGKDYYQFDYGNGWQNVPSGGEVYRENALDRWEVLKDLVSGHTVLDLGCNEGYLGLQLARQGKEVVGIDHDWTHIAYLNKLIYEWLEQRDLKIRFQEGNIVDTTETADTILLLNVIYHLPKAQQAPLLAKFKGKQLIFQCNLRKERERATYYGSHPDDLRELLERVGCRVEQIINWRDKPIVIAYGPN